jgi:hypothetical protein
MASSRLLTKKLTDFLFGFLFAKLGAYLRHYSFTNTFLIQPHEGIVTVAVAFLKKQN